jgi:hypothetical protein
MIDNILPSPDAESLPLYRMVLKLACVCVLHCVVVNINIGVVLVVQSRVRTSSSQYLIQYRVSRYLGPMTSDIAVNV